LALSTHTCQWRFSGQLSGVLCKPPFAEFIEKDGNSVQAVIAGFLLAMWENCIRVTAVQNGDRARSTHFGPSPVAKADGQRTMEFRGQAMEVRHTALSVRDLENNHSIRAQQQRLRDGDAERLRGSSC
jgi:hypothetical protein